MSVASWVLNAALVIALAAGPERHASPAEEDVVRAAMHTWHRGERVSGFGPFAGTGAATVGAGLALVTQPSRVSQSAGWPLLGLGVVELIAGLYFGLSSFGKEARLDALWVANRSEFLAVEQARIGRVTHLFQPVLLSIEGAVAVAGGVLSGIGAVGGDDTVLGLGLGLAIQGVLLFLLDWAVLDRAQAYEGVLRF